jgi:hypothetical protein
LECSPRAGLLNPVPNKDDDRRSAGHHPTVRCWSRRYMFQWQ